MEIAMRSLRKARLESVCMYTHCRKIAWRLHGDCMEIAWRSLRTARLESVMHVHTLQEDCMEIAWRLQ